MTDFHNQRFDYVVIGGGASFRFPPTHVEKAVSASIGGEVHAPPVAFLMGVIWVFG